MGVRWTEPGAGCRTTINRWVLGLAASFAVLTYLYRGAIHFIDGDRR